MQISALLKEFYQRKDELFSLICHFNAAPAEYIHPSHLASAIPKAVFDALLASERGKTKLNELVLQKFKLKGAFHTDFRLLHLRLALLDPQTLANLVLHAGAIYYSKNIVQVVEKKALLDIKEKIGEAIYTFAVKKAPLFNRLKPQITTLSPNPSNLYLGIIAAGQRMLEHLFSSEPASIQQRLQLKLPADYSWSFTRSGTEAERTNIYSFLHRLLIKEINPNWQLCFT